MRAEPKSSPSFSTANRWRIGFDVVLRTVLVLAVVGMLNYLGAKFYHRYYLSSQTRTVLSSATLTVLRSLTNHVEVTLYYDRHADFYPDIVALLNEYRAANKNISVQTVDYVRDAGAAEQTKVKYRQYFTSQSDKDQIIFDCAGRVRVFPGSELVSSQYKLTGMEPDPADPKKPKMDFQRRPVAFNGEKAFTSILLALANPQPLKAYFLKGHGEAALDDTSTAGFLKFAEVLAQNYISVTNLDWVGNSGVPMDCNLLVIAGPDQPFKEPELQAISQYLHEGGRLLLLFNFLSQGHPTGLEAILQNWGLGVMDDIAQDASHTMTTHDIIVDTFNQHPVVDSLSQVQLQLYEPRPILKIQTAQVANAPEVHELFATSAGGTLVNDRRAPPANYPLACAVEQKPVAGVTNPRGNTRMIVVGDDIFLGNYYIDSGGNRDFLNAAVNWLCARDPLLTGIGPRPVTDFRLQITRHQQVQLNWLLLAVLPGGVLAFGWLVWLVRRK
jgi:ABC-type uncharacterized transport system involved in gliding motility auxiliary subunit